MSFFLALAEKAGGEADCQLSVAEGGAEYHLIFYSQQVAKNPDISISSASRPDAFL
jgi:hypothetical protein